MPGRTFSAGSGYRYGFNGQEKSDDINKGNYTAQFWEYDSRIGRRWNLDPKPNKSISLYAVFANNPIWIKDPLGDTIIVNGDAEFKSNTQINLAKIAETKQGKKLIERLQNSTTIYTIKEAWMLNNSSYDESTGIIKYDDNPWRTSLDGGAINGLITLSHELGHAYADDVIPGGVSKISRENAESMAVNFQNYVTSVYNLGDMRTRYSGSSLEFSSDENYYNPEKEKLPILKEL